MPNRIKRKNVHLKMNYFANKIDLQNGDYFLNFSWYIPITNTNTNLATSR